MQALDGLNETLARDGVIVRENLLPDTWFDMHRARVIESWHNGTAWETRIKVGDDNRILPRQPESAMPGIAEQVRQSKSDNAFQYLYHSMHESKDTHGIVLPIVEDVRQAWRTELARIAPSANMTSFSLTSFNTGCFLDPHNDHSGNEKPFAVTLLLYFGSQDVEDSGGLVFNYRGRKRVIPAKANVGVLFVPSPETEHWVEPIPMQAGARLALSGWLL
ncbi:MAG: 2OG-Fe(II) oxygenase [Pseudomonadota bacterium]